MHAFLFLELERSTCRPARGGGGGEGSRPDSECCEGGSPDLSLRANGYGNEKGTN